MISKKNVYYCKLCRLNTEYLYTVNTKIQLIPPPNRILILKVQPKSIVSYLFTY